MAKLPVLRTVEDLVVVAGAAVTTWQTTHSIDDVVTAAGAAPVVRSSLALVLSKARSSGLVEAVGIVYKALNLLDEVPSAPTSTQTTTTGVSS